MAGWVPSETTLVALFSVFFGGGAAALINAAVQKTLKRTDVASAGLASVLSGYNSLIDQHQKTIDTLRQQVADLETKMTDQGQECDKRIKHLEDEMLRLHEMYQRRLRDQERQPRSTGE